MTGKDKYTRVAIIHCDNFETFTNFMQDHFCHLNIRMISFLVIGIKYIQILSIRAKAFDVNFSYRVSNTIKHFIGMFDQRDSLAREVTNCFNARANDS